jgi:hypothetical protein
MRHARTQKPVDDRHLAPGGGPRMTKARQFVAASHDGTRTNIVEHRRSVAQVLPPRQRLLDRRLRHASQSSAAYTSSVQDAVCPFTAPSPWPTPPPRSSQPKKRNRKQKVAEDRHLKSAGASSTPDRQRAASLLQRDRWRVQQRFPNPIFSQILRKSFRCILPNSRIRRPIVCATARCPPLGSGADTPCSSIGRFRQNPRFREQLHVAHGFRFQVGNRKERVFLIH